MISWAMLFVQAGLAIIGLRCAVRIASTPLPHEAQRMLVLDVWLPIALIAPLLCRAGFMQGDILTTGWIASAPTLLAWISLAAVLALRERFKQWPDLQPRPVIIWTYTGLVFVLLTSLSSISVWSGQLTFAIAAVLMWMNAPSRVPDTPAGDAASRTTGPAMLLLVATAFGQGFAGLLAGAELAAYSGAIAITWAACSLAVLAGLAGPGHALRTAGWAACYGFLFSVGIASLLWMVPYTLAAVAQPGPIPSELIVATGFGRFAVEATMLAVFAAAVWALGRLHSTAGMIISGVIVVASAALIAFRLGAMLADTA